MTTAEDRSKHIDHWRYEIGACMMCGLCVEACPFDAIEMSHDYELARIDPASLTVDLLTDVAAAQPKRRLEASLQCAPEELAGSQPGSTAETGPPRGGADA